MLSALSAWQCREKIRDVIPEQRDVAQGPRGKVLSSEYGPSPGERFHVKHLSECTRAAYLVSELKDYVRMDGKHVLWKNVDVAFLDCHHKSLKGYLKAWDCDTTSHCFPSIVVATGLEGASSVLVSKEGGSV